MGAVVVVDGDVLAMKRSLDIEVYAAERQVMKRPALSTVEHTAITEAIASVDSFNFHLHIWRSQ